MSSTSVGGSLGNSTGSSSGSSSSQSQQSTQVLPGLMSGYADLLGRNQNAYNQAVGAYGSAENQLGGNLNSLYPQYQGLSNDVGNTLGMGQVLGQNGNWGVAGVAAQQIGQNLQKQQGATQQQLTSSGLGNSTIGENLQAQNTYNANLAYGNLGQQLAQTYANQQSQIGQAGLASRLQGAGMQANLAGQGAQGMMSHNYANTMGQLTGSFGSSSSQSNQASHQQSNEKSGNASQGGQPGTSGGPGNFGGQGSTPYMGAGGGGTAGGGGYSSLTGGGGPSTTDVSGSPSNPSYPSAPGTPQNPGGQQILGFGTSGGVGASATGQQGLGNQGPILGGGGSGGTGSEISAPYQPGAPGTNAYPTEDQGTNTDPMTNGGALTYGDQVINMEPGGDSITMADGSTAYKIHGVDSQGRQRYGNDSNISGFTVGPKGSGADVQY